MSLLSSVLGVIPARMGSTRFPGKPLALILGKPMIQWVYVHAKKALPYVVVATDDKKIFQVVNSFGGKAIMTPRSCKSGTDRMNHVSKKMKANYYVNIQGDEPMMATSTIYDATLLALKNKAIGTSATDLNPLDYNNPNSVKVVVAHDGRALYFSRNMIPSGISKNEKTKAVLKHQGLYVYPKNVLAQFPSWPQPEIELRERLEQLRALYQGCPIYVAYTKKDSIGVDTPADLKKVEKILKSRGEKYA